MDALTTPDAYGVLIDPSTLKIQRRLPGPIEKVWAYITENNLRRQWFAAGEMEMTPDATFEFIWRNDELTAPPSQRPPGFSEEHRMESKITELDPPRKLSITWENSGEVTFDLVPEGDMVLLSVTHRGLTDRDSILMFGAGWHMHLDILNAKMTGKKPTPFWEGWSQLQKEYDQRLPV